MTISNINEFHSIIKQQISTQELIFEYANKARVLLSYALESDLIKSPPETTNYYFWTVCDLAEKACALSEKALDRLIKTQRGNFSITD